MKLVASFPTLLPVKVAGTSDLSGYIPYTGATSAVNLGTQNLLTTGTLGAGAGTLTSLNTHTIPTGTGTLALTTDVSGLLSSANTWTNTNNFKKNSTGALVVEKEDGTDVFVVDTTTGGIAVNGATKSYAQISCDIDSTHQYIGDFRGTVTNPTLNSQAGLFFSLTGDGAKNSEYGGYGLYGQFQNLVGSNTTSAVSRITNGLYFVAYTGADYYNSGNITITTKAMAVAGYTISRLNGSGNDTIKTYGAEITSGYNPNFSGEQYKTGGSIDSDLWSIKATSTLNEDWLGDLTSATLSGDNCGAEFNTLIYMGNIIYGDTGWRPDSYGVKTTILIDDMNANTDYKAYCFWGDILSTVDDAYFLYNNCTGTGAKSLIGKDNIKTLFGTGEDASIYYDGTNLVINPKEVGSGVISVLGNIALGSNTLTTSNGTVVANLNADRWDGYDFSDFLNQAVKSTSTPQFAKLTTNAGSFEIVNTNSTDLAMQAYTSTDDYDRFDISIAGLIRWGTGSDATLDVNLYRDAANILKTDDTFVTGGELRIGGDVGGAASTNTITNTSNVAANSTGVGTILFKGTTSRNSSGFIKIYIGTTAYYVPVFSAITG